ncbi:MAG: hypothetical protein Q8P67_21940, partial [archaeon]|nr:hypothetical protein [archaeon]
MSSMGSREVGEGMKGGVAEGGLAVGGELPWRRTARLPTELYGVLMVVHRSFAGKFMVFRYPPVRRDGLSEETREAFLRTQRGGPASNAQLPQEKMRTATFDDRKQQRLAASIRYGGDAYQLPSVLLSPLLLPKKALLDQDFEVNVERTCFLG